MALPKTHGGPNPTILLACLPLRNFLHGVSAAKMKRKCDR